MEKYTYEVQSSLERQKDTIDHIDHQILNLVTWRQETAREIVRLKKLLHEPALDIAREREIIYKLLKTNPPNLSRHAVVHIWREIISAARTIQETQNEDPAVELFAFFGNPIIQSPSAMMFNMAFTLTGYPGMFIPVAVEDIGQAISAVRTLHMKGASITMPHKIDAVQYLDELDPMAEKIGAVNVVLNNNGRLKGYNTDGLGAFQALSEKINIKKGIKAAILGAGGTARGIAYMLLSAGADVKVYYRTASLAGKLGLKEALGIDVFPLAHFGRKEHQEFDILINTTPVGMFPHLRQTPVRPETLKPDMVVMDAVYIPLKTRLLEVAEQKGCQIVDGTSMLVNQGAAQFELWTGIRPPIGDLSDAVREFLAGAPAEY